MEETPREVASREFAKQAVAFVFLVLGMLAVMAIQDPDFLRTQRMRLAAASRQLLSWSARRVGHISMGTELATGHQQYTIPYQLSLLRDKMNKIYEQERGS